MSNLEIRDSMVSSPDILEPLNCLHCVFMLMKIKGKPIHLKNKSLVLMVHRSVHFG
jgi:hypothetical protein